MSDFQSPDAISASRGVSPVGGSSEVRRTAGTPEDGAAFRALLERLETQARDLSRESSEAIGPDDLAGAVENARNALEDALSLGDQLLEAYRAAATRGEVGPSAEAGDSGGAPGGGGGR